MSKLGTRERIRQAALERFATDGYQRTSIARLETEAGLAPRAGAFYRHFESKEALLRDLARDIAEVPEQFELEELAAFGNTRSELVAIALKYEEASRRQRPFAKLIAEIRALAIAVDLENELNEAMGKALARWIASKPAGRRLSAKRRIALAVTVFGSWLFYLTKLQENVTLADRDVLLDEWASRWAEALDAQ